MSYLIDACVPSRPTKRLSRGLVLDLPSGATLWWLAAFLLLPAWTVQAQTATVRGFITAASDREPLQGVNVTLHHADGSIYGVATDGDGLYALSRIPAGVYAFRASFIGFETYTDTLALEGSAIRVLNLALESSEEELDEVVVEAEGETGSANLTAGLQSVRAQDIERVPAPDVSGDLATYLTTLPGVVSLGDRGGQLFVRGGEPSHNLVLLDGMYVHQPFHMLGFYSAFPSDIINRVDLHAAGFGAMFSGRIASVIDVHTRTGNKRQFDGAASVAPFVSAARVEGPLIRNHMSFIASGRRSVIEEAAAQYVDQPLPFEFGDAFAKIHTELGRNHRLSVSGLYTFDRGTLGTPTEDKVFDAIQWKNAAAGLRYLVLPSRVPFVAEILASYSYLNSSQGPAEAPVRSTTFEGFNYAVNMTFFMPGAEWHWGLFWRAPQIESELGGAFQNVEFGFARRHKAGLYIEPDFIIDDTWRLRVGITAQMFPGQENAAFVEPRLRLRWRRGRHEASAAGGLHHQEVFGLNDRRDVTNIFTAWRSAPTTNLSRAWHALAGYRVNPTAWLELAAEGYYKHLSNLYIAEWTAFPRFTSGLQLADGRVLGLDLRLEVRRPHFYGFANYGLSSVRYEARQESIALWYGTERLAFRPPHDRRHQLDILGSVPLFGADATVRWQFGSGRPYNRVYGFDGYVFMHGVQDIFTAPDEQRVIYERPFQGLLPTYHRLDLSLERRFDFDGFGMTLQAGAINVYDRRNLFALDIFTLRRVDQLPFIPTFGLKIDTD